MKKTLIAMLALGSMAMADTPQYEFTLSSGLTSTVDQTTVSAFDAMVGLTEANAEQATPGLNADHLGALSACNLFINNMLLTTTAPVGLSDEMYNITDISFVTRFDYRSEPAGSLTITISGQNYTSSSVAYTYFGGASTDQMGYVTYHFDTPVQTPMTTTQIDATLTSGPSISVAMANNGYTLAGTNGVHNSWQAVAQLKGFVTPEPTTTTLSLLALAGLAARRKRH